MPADSRHPEYQEFLPLWEKCRDCVAGEETIKARSTRYLPRLSGQRQEEYLAYRDRALFFNATARTLEGLVGAIFRKPPLVDLPQPIEYLNSSADSLGTPLPIFMRVAAEQILTTGRFGILADCPQQPGGKPYLAAYRAEEILNWRVANHNGYQHLEQLVLAEQLEQPNPDGFGSHYIPQLRELLLVNGHYQQRLYQFKNHEWVQIQNPITPTKRGQPFSTIPFVILSPVDLNWEFRKPPILDLVNVNLSHYRSSADLEHGRHFTALPTPYITGYQRRSQTETSLRIGSGSAWVLGEGVQVGMLEFTGAGLSFLENALTQKEGLMTLLGARLLEPQKRAAETAETLRLRQAGESSVLATIATTLGLGMKKILETAANWWDADPQTLRIEINRDFFDSRMSPEELTALISAWQAGALSNSSLEWNLRQGELLPAGEGIPA